MRATVFLISLLGFIGSAHGAPITLICNGSLTLDGKQSDIVRETAIVDMDRRMLKPPLYPEFPITAVKENDITFGSEMTNLSASGGLDRVSGTLYFNAMLPAERKNLQAGGTFKFIAWMSAKCVPAQRMF